jgi:hypothetical protein
MRINSRHYTTVIWMPWWAVGLGYIGLAIFWFYVIVLIGPYWVIWKVACWLLRPDPRRAAMMAKANARLLTWVRSHGKPPGKHRKSALEEHFPSQGRT